MKTIAKLLVAPVSLAMSCVGFCLGFGGVSGLYMEHPVGSELTLYMVVILFGLGCLLLAVPIRDIEMMYNKCVEEKRVPPA